LNDIVGMFHRDGGPVDSGLLDGVTDSMTTRGQMESSGIPLWGLSLRCNLTIPGLGKIDQSRRFILSGFATERL
jgi:hypothetical protein